MKYDQIFLVDDEPIVNAIQSLMLKKHFSEESFLNFNTSTEALKVISGIDHTQQKILLFLDLNMPVLDAIEFLKELDALDLPAYPDIYIITFSKNPEELEFVGKHRLVKDVVFKPLDDAKISKIKQELSS